MLLPLSYNRSRAGNNQSLITSYLSGVISDSSSKLWKVRDCHTPWNKNAAAAATLRADCNLRINSISTLRYAYPKIEWRTFGPKTVTAAFDKWKTAYTGTVNALGKLRASVKSSKNGRLKSFIPAMFRPSMYLAM